jgi:hypothetical protein
MSSRERGVKRERERDRDDRGDRGEREPRAFLHYRLLVLSKKVSFAVVET